MKQKLTAWILAAGAAILNPALLLAQNTDDSVYDGRLEGYRNGAQELNVTLVTKTPMLMWPLIVVLALVCIGVLFKNAKRSHLS